MPDYVCARCHILSHDPLQTDTLFICPACGTTNRVAGGMATAEDLVNVPPDDVAKLKKARGAVIPRRRRP